MWCGHINHALLRVFHGTMYTTIHYHTISSRCIVIVRGFGDVLTRLDDAIVRQYVKATGNDELSTPLDVPFISPILSHLVSSSKSTCCVLVQIIGMCLISIVLVAFGSSKLAGSFRVRLAAADYASRPSQTASLREDFMVFNHRGRTLAQLRPQTRVQQPYAPSLPCAIPVSPPFHHHQHLIIQTLILHLLISPCICSTDLIRLNIFKLNLMQSTIARKTAAIDRKSLSE